jgi:hypothetical protein
MARSRNTRDTKPPRLENAPLEYAPENEHGVVFLFAALANRRGLRVESVQAGFPDCIAYQRTGKGDKRNRIEFEFYSSNLQTHGHDPKGCDWTVCWEHDWHDVPARIEVIELHREFGLGFNGWIQPVADPYKDKPSDMNKGEWSVPGRLPLPRFGGMLPLLPELEFVPESGGGMLAVRPSKSARPKPWAAGLSDPPTCQDAPAPLTPHPRVPQEALTPHDHPAPEIKCPISFFCRPPWRRTVGW